MAAVTPFLFESDHLVRVVMIDDEPWFVAADVCAVLEHSNSRVALSRLDSDEKGVSIVYTPGGRQEMAVINESGLYVLILTSRKPAAKRFRKWVTAEVLPSIRKTGKYEAAPELDRATPLDALPLDDVRAWTRMIHECRIVHGKAAARQLWTQSPLPQVGDPSTSNPGTMNDADAQGCLTHLLDWRPVAGGVTIAERLDNDAASLPCFGLRLSPPGWNGWLAVSNTHPALRTLYHATPWRDTWRSILLLLPGARLSDRAFKFDRHVARAVLVPHRTAS